MLAAIYLSFIVLAPLVGWIADLFSLQAALLTLVVSGVGILLLTWRQVRE
jgi:hypothetical protein